MPQASSSSESLNWAKAKLDECLTTHSACSSSPITTLPDRILDVSDSLGCGIQLKETNGESDRYLCLSHCWGTQPFLRSTRSNLAAHKDNIPLEDLPATFKDAVKLTRRLELRYLWIDSLCIVQDDEEDWRRQSSKMADIYANAHLTISALHSNGPRGGLFSLLKPGMRAHRLSAPALSFGDRGNLGIYARRAIAHIDARYLGSLATSSLQNKDLPLLKRAWSFQERFLSRRVLYFTASELSWECSSSSSCQCRGDQGATSTAHRAPRIANPREYYHPSSVTSAFHRKGKDEVARRWLSLVADYSRLDMTFERDVFPALSGLAKAFGTLLNTRYAAGIWENCIRPGLLWHPDDGGREWGGRPREWRAPSWSWGSTKTAVSFPSVTNLLHPCKIASVDCPLRGPDPTGEVAGGELIVRGLVSSARVKYRAVGGERRSWNVYVLDFMDGKMLGNSYADYDWALDGPGKVEDGTPVWCLLVGVHPELSNCYLLVLKDSVVQDGSAANTLERIGLVEIFGHKVRKASRDGTVRMVSPYQVIEERSVEDTITLV